MKKLIFCIIAISHLTAPALAVTFKNVNLKSVRSEGATPRLMFMGDSITEGTGNGAWGYRLYFQQNIAPLKYSYVGSYTDPDSDATYDVDHSGVSGNQVEDLNSRIDSELDTGFTGTRKGDVITILIGTNDIGSASNPFTAKMATLTGIINKIVAHDPTISIYLMTIPDRSGATQSSLDWNTQLSSLVSGFGKSNLYLVDTRAAWNLTSNCPTSYTTSCTTDGLHPNENGHAVLAQTLAQFIKQHQ